MRLLAIRLYSAAKHEPARRSFAIPEGRAPVSVCQDKPGPAVDELACSVEVAGVACGLSKHVQDDLPQILWPRVGREMILGPPGQWGVQRSGDNDGVREPYLLPIQVEGGRGRHVGDNLPGAIPGFEIDRLTGDDGTEPEPLDDQGEMPHQSQARPTRRQHRMSQSFLRKAVQDPEHVIALAGQGREERLTLLAHCRLRQSSSTV